MHLIERAVSGVKWTAFASIIANVFGIIQLAILTRLLEPADFGLMALAWIAIGFSELFIDMGISNAIIYKKDTTEVQINTLYFLNIIVGVIFFFAMIFISPLLAEFYETPELVNILNLIALTFIIKPFGQTFMLLLQKEMKFDSIAKSELISRIITFFIVITLAYLEYGVYSLAVGAIIFALLSTAGYIYYGRKEHKVKLRVDIFNIREYLVFGIYQMGEKVLNYLSSQFDTIIIGKLLGVEVLGIYNVAKNFAMKPFRLFNPIVRKVTFPLMSKINEDKKYLRHIYLRVIKYLAYINIPLYALMIILAEPLIISLFGNQWIQSIPIFKILSINLIITTISNPQGILLLSQGKARKAFLWNLFVFVLYPLAIYLGSSWGIMGIVYTSLVLKLVFLFLSFQFVIKESCGATIVESFEAISKPVIISSFCMLIISFLDIFDIYIYDMLFRGTIFIVIVIVLIFLMDKAFYLRIIELSGIDNYLKN